MTKQKGIIRKLYLFNDIIQLLKNLEFFLHNDDIEKFRSDINKIQDDIKNDQWYWILPRYQKLNRQYFRFQDEKSKKVNKSNE